MISDGNYSASQQFYCSSHLEYKSTFTIRINCKIEFWRTRNGNAIGMNYPYDMQIKICTNEGPRVLRAQALDVLLETRTAYLVVGGGLYMFTFLCCGFCFVLCPQYPGTFICTNLNLHIIVIVHANCISIPSSSEFYFTIYSNCKGGFILQVRRAITLLRWRTDTIVKSLLSCRVATIVFSILVCVT
jgi:hypothetical protein